MINLFSSFNLCIPENPYKIDLGNLREKIG